MIKKLFVILAIMVVFFPGLYLTGYFIRKEIYDNKQDPIAEAVGKTLGDSQLVPGSELGIWIEVLGEPDLVVKSKDKYRGKSTEFYWLNRGIGVSASGWFQREPNIHTSNRVRMLILPMEEKMSKNDTNEAVWYKNLSNIEFHNTLNTKIGSENLIDMTPAQIEGLYKHYDESEHAYSIMPFSLSKVRTILFLKPESTKIKGERNIYFRDSVEIIVLSYFDMFNIFDWLDIITH